MVKSKEGKKEEDSKDTKSEYHNNEEVNERKYSTRLACSESTKKLIMEECAEEFLAHHPELRGINITQNMMLRQIAEYYLNH